MSARALHQEFQRRIALGDLFDERKKLRQPQAAFVVAQQHTRARADARLLERLAARLADKNRGAPFEGGRQPGRDGRIQHHDQRHARWQHARQVGIGQRDHRTARRELRLPVGKERGVFGG